MALSLAKWKQYLPKILWGLLGLLVVGFFVRVAIWENGYYAEKEGSERATATSSTTSALDVDESDVSDSDRSAWTVAKDRPRYLSISKLGITNARVREVGLTANNELSTPSNIFDVGWYFDSGKPGEGKTMIIDGHNGGPTKNGVFKNLPNLAEGDIITIERGDGAIFNYRVVESVSVKLEDADAWMSKAGVSAEQGKEGLTLISCTGEWSQTKQTYLSRQFVRAVLAD